MSTTEPTAVVPGNFVVRFVVILIYVVILGVVRFALWAVLLVQLLSHLFTGRANPTAQKVGKAVAEYVYRIWLYLSYNTNDRPFPFRHDQS